MTTFNINEKKKKTSHERMRVNIRKKIVFCGSVFFFHLLHYIPNWFMLFSTLKENRKIPRVFFHMKEKK